MLIKMSVNHHLAASIRSFLEEFQNDPKNHKPCGNAQPSSTSFMSRFDPTTANAFNTDTVVILRNKKKNDNLRNSPFEGVALGNYKLKLQDVRREVFDWVYHFLLNKNCPVELATTLAKTIASKMEHELNNGHAAMVETNDDNNKGSDLGSSTVTPEKTEAENGERETLRSGDDGNTMVVDTLDSALSSSHSFLPSAPALTSIEVAKQSRELVAEYISELSAEPEKALTMVSDYIDGSDAGACTNGHNNNAHTVMPLSSSVYAIKNARKTMEDRHIVIHDLNKTLELELPNQYSYYAIFDGHAGVDAASYSTAHLHHNLVATQAFREGRIEQAFHEAFEQTDSLYLKRCREESIGSPRASGTTALCALIENNKTVYIAWVGDSQAVLVRNGRSEEIMLPHRPDVESERVRIQDLGGLVVFVDTWRVNGVLGVTRAIGDPDHKPYVIAEPSLAKFEIDPTLDFLVLGCDGLFDQLTGQDIASHVFEYLCRNEGQEPQAVMEGVSAHLSKMAIEEGSNDNITSIVLFFKPFDQLVATGFPTQTDGNAFEAVNSELNLQRAELGSFEAKDEAAIDSAANEFVTISTTNGGHFPYTDFAEIPVGSNYKITGEENGNGLAQFDSMIDGTLNLEPANNLGDDQLDFQAVPKHDPTPDFTVDTEYNNQKEALFEESLQKEQQQAAECSQESHQHALIDNESEMEMEHMPLASSSIKQVEVEVHHSVVVSDPFAAEPTEFIDKKLFDDDFETIEKKQDEPVAQHSAQDDFMTDNMSAFDNPPAEVGFNPFVEDQQVSSSTTNEASAISVDAKDDFVFASENGNGAHLEAHLNEPELFATPSPVGLADNSNTRTCFNSSNAETTIWQGDSLEQSTNSAGNLFDRSASPVDVEEHQGAFEDHNVPPSIGTNTGENPFFDWPAATVDSVAIERNVTEQNVAQSTAPVETLIFGLSDEPQDSSAGQMLNESIDALVGPEEPETLVTPCQSVTVAIDEIGEVQVEQESAPEPSLIVYAVDQTVSATLVETSESLPQPIAVQDAEISTTEASAANIDVAESVPESTFDNKPQDGPNDIATEVPVPIPSDSGSVLVEPTPEVPPPEASVSDVPLVAVAAAGVAVAGAAAAVAAAGATKKAIAPKKPALTKPTTNKATTSTATLPAKKLTSTSAMTKPKTTVTRSTASTSRLVSQPAATTTGATKTSTTRLPATRVPLSKASAPAATRATAAPGRSTAAATTTARQAPASRVAPVASSTLASRKPLTTTAATASRAVPASSRVATTTGTAAARARPATTGTTGSTTSAPTTTRVPLASRKPITGVTRTAAPTKTTVAATKPSPTTAAVSRAGPSTSRLATSTAATRTARTATATSKPASSSRSVPSPASRPAATSVAKSSPSTRTKPTSSAPRSAPKAAAAPIEASTTPKENGVKSITGRKSLTALAANKAPATQSGPAPPSSSASNTNGICGEPAAAPKSSPSFSKRNNLIGVENSLKQELEDAALNELNNANNASLGGDLAGLGVVEVVPVVHDDNPAVDSPDTVNGH